MAISAAPTATAEARQELLMLRPGVLTIASSMLYSIAGGTRMRTKAATTSRTITSIFWRSSGPARLMNAVSRMCALRRVARTAPRDESHTNRVDASSSAQMSGLWKT